MAKLSIPVRRLCPPDMCMASAGSWRRTRCFPGSAATWPHAHRAHPETFASNVMPRTNAIAIGVPTGRMRHACM